MPDHSIILPSKPKVVREDGTIGVYEIEGLYPGYGHTLGNSLRRIILSSLPGAAVTAINIPDVPHEFSTIPGVKEDVVNILLNIKHIRFKLATTEPQTVTLSVKGARAVTAQDLTLPGQVELMNPEQHIATITDKGTTLRFELRVEQGLGYVPKEVLHREKIDIGTIALDAVFTPIRRVHYEVENMRVGNRTDYNRLRMVIETDGIIAPREALSQAVTTMINQLKSIVGFEEEATYEPEGRDQHDEAPATSEAGKIRIEDVTLSVRTQKALAGAGVRTLAGLSRKKESDLHEIDGLGEKGIQEIKELLAHYELTLKDE